MAADASGVHVFRRTPGASLVWKECWGWKACGVFGMPACVGAFLLVTLAPGGALAAVRGAERCFNAAEARMLVNQKMVSGPGAVLQKLRAAAGPGARVLRAVLCRRDGRFYYHVTILRKDGKVVRHATPVRHGRADVSRQLNRNAR